VVDIHSHILAGLDDGAADFETSLAMCRMAARTGVREIVATPHSNLRYAYDPAQVRAKIAELQSELGETIFIHRGCDLHLSWDNISAAVEDPQRFSINKSQYLLVEFADDLLLTGASDVLDNLGEAGLTPIVTHPERNPYLRRSMQRLQHWVDRGCLLQVTSGSLLGDFGERAQAAAFRMMELDMVHFVASDSHDLRDRRPNLDQAYDAVVYRWGQERAERLFIDHPWAALWGEKIEPPSPKRPRRSIVSRLLRPKRKRARRRAQPL
jgi:protein-tyrosine phosphatase